MSCLDADLESSRMLADATGLLNIIISLHHKRLLFVIRETNELFHHAVDQELVSSLRNVQKHCPGVRSAYF